MHQERFQEAAAGGSGIRQEMERHLDRSSLFMHFTPAVEAEFLEQRGQQFARMARLGVPAGILLTAVVAVTSFLGFNESLTPQTLALIGFALGLAPAAVLAAAITLSTTAGLRHYDLVVAGTGALMLGATLYISIVIGDSRLGQNMMHVSMLLIVAGALAGRLSMLQSALSAMAGGTGALLFALYMGGRPDWWQLLHYFLGTVAISQFVAWILEREERTSFLRAILLKEEGLERERLNDELARMAREDGLTGLANRRCFDEKLVQEWERTRRNQIPLAILFIDVDHFKRYNDRYGHQAGDACLAAVAAAIRKNALRPADMASRYGGEEFVVLLPETDIKGAEEVAERIHSTMQALALPHEDSPTASHVTVSIGVTACIPQVGLAQSLLKEADVALYGAKQAGRNRTVVASTYAT